MDMSYIDWLIVMGLVLFVAYAAITTKKYTKSVADFLAANRCAGRYLLGTADGIAAHGAVTIIVIFEVFTQAGFTSHFWTNFSLPIVLFVNLSGFVVYRYRATRAMTMGQFFEMRYSRKFRTYAGILAWVSGVINYGIFPSIGARFFINFCGFPNHFVQVGPLEINLTLAAVMLILIGIALFFTFIGGQIAILVTDFWQGFFSIIVFMVLVVFVWTTISWTEMTEALKLASVSGKSMFNPLDIGQKRDFNFTFFAIMWFFIVYYYMAWQGMQAYNCSAASPHEAKMSKIVGTLRGVLFTLGVSLLPLAAVTVMHHPNYVDKAELITNALQNSFPGNETLQIQMQVPVALKSILPVGLVGCFAAVMLAFFVSTNNTYMHSWGSIFVQDVICVLRKTPLSQKMHLRYLRCSILFVAIVAFFFSLLFPLQEYIWMFMLITGAIYLGGAGSVIIGGLYWKRGTTAGAWSAMTVGSLLAVGTIVFRIAWPHIPYCVQRFGDEFPYNSQLMSFGAAIVSIVTYVVVSLLGNKPDIIMDKLFHRGQYALPEDKAALESVERKPIGRLWKMIGVNNHEFSRIDKGLYVYMVAMNGFWIISVLLLLGFGLLGWMTDRRWFAWWKFYICLQTIIAFIGGSWVGIGGLFDLRKMYRKLREAKRDMLDDGRAEDEHVVDKNIDNQTLKPKSSDVCEREA